MARVKFIRDKEPNILALPASKTVIDGALYVATDTGSMWLGSSDASLIQIKDNIDTQDSFVVTMEPLSSSTFSSSAAFSEIKSAILMGKNVVGIDGKQYRSYFAVWNGSTIYFIYMNPPTNTVDCLKLEERNPTTLIRTVIYDDSVKLYSSLGTNMDGAVTQKVTNSLITYSETEPTDSNCRIWVEI